jgi:hypothetical protein
MLNKFPLKLSNIFSSFILIQRTFLKTNRQPFFFKKQKPAFQQPALFINNKNQARYCINATFPL